MSSKIFMDDLDRLLSLFEGEFGRLVIPLRHQVRFLREEVCQLKLENERLKARCGTLENQVMQLAQEFLPSPAWWQQVSLKRSERAGSEPANPLPAKQTIGR